MGISPGISAEVESVPLSDSAEQARLAVKSKASARCMSIKNTGVSARGKLEQWIGQGVRMRTHTV